jgi:hypothetical protein
MFGLPRLAPATQTNTSGQSALIRERLMRRCVEELRAFLKMPKSGTNDLRDVDIKTLLAVAELQRTELLAQSGQQHELITDNVVVKMIEALATS